MKKLIDAVSDNLKRCACAGFRASATARLTPSRRLLCTRGCSVEQGLPPDGALDAVRAGIRDKVGRNELKRCAGNDDALRAVAMMQ